MTAPETLGLDLRRAGFLAGATIGSSLAARTTDSGDPSDIARILVNRPLPLAPPPGRRPASTALGDALIQELLLGGVDLQRLAGRWIRWWRSDGLDADLPLTEALAHLESYDAPIDNLSGHSSAVLAATLPAALAAASPQSMVTGTFHTARMLDPSPESGLAAVAVVVAASRFLGGSRDFIADVLTLLRQNGAPAAFFDRFQSIPRDPAQQPSVPRAGVASATDVAIWALWHAHHRPRSAESLLQMVATGGVASSTGAVLGAVLGARDGIEAWPADWRTEAGEEVSLRLALAEQLAS